MKRNMLLEGAEAAAELIDTFRMTLQVKAESIPSTRCFSQPDLVRHLLEARQSLNLTLLRRHSGIKLIALLEQAGVAQRIPITPLSSATKADRLYTVGFETNTFVSLEPAEILQAHIPEGVACYFTAIQLHGLSTQPAPHHHIAKMRPPIKQQMAAPPIVSEDRLASLGTAQFTLDDVPYYVTQRDPQWLRSTQQRQLNPYSRATVTTLEQTLLDCLHRPASAGGPAIVFEAWETGLSQTNPDRIISLAMTIQSESLVRRVGYMLDRFLESNRQVLDQLRADLEPVKHPVSLLPGIPYHQNNVDWGVRTP